MKQLNLFTPVVPSDQLNSLFRIVSTSEHQVPSRHGMQQAFALLPNPDGNFIKDFQTAGFSARVWELYLNAYARSVDVLVERPHDRPDFLLRKGNLRVWLEATTANPTVGSLGRTDAPLGFWDYHDAVGIKLGSALWSKLNKRYWELPHVSGLPIVLAIADFHREDPLRDCGHALERYLYGAHLQVKPEPGDPTAYRLHELSTLRAGTKEIPAGFFKQPDAENISAVLFSNAGTVAKFNRMSWNRFLHTNLRMLRYGFSYDPNPNAFVPEPFAYIVGDAPESWQQEVVVYHNPKAFYPIPEDFFGAVVQYRLDGKLFRVLTPEFHPMISVTKSVVSQPNRMPAIERKLRIMGRKWALLMHSKLPSIEDLVLTQHEGWNAVGDE